MAHGRRLSNWIEGYLKFTENTESPKSYHLWVAISCIASALQRRVFQRWGHDKIYPNQYIVLVGPSGQARKGAAISIGKSLVRDVNIPIVGQDNSIEAIIRDVRLAVSSFQNPETGMPQFQSAVSCFSDEFAVFTGQQNTRLLSYLTEWWESLDNWKRTTKNMGTDDIVGICVNLLAATAPDWIPYILPKEAIGGGFTSRCMFIVENRKGRTIADPNAFEIPKRLREDLLYDLEQMTLLTGEAHFDAEAHEIYCAWYEEQDRKIAAGQIEVRDPAFMGYYSRKATHLKKVAVALSVAERSDLVINGEHVRRALSLLSGVESTMSQVYAGIGKAKYAEETDKILDYMKRNGKVTKGQLLKDFYRNIDEPGLEGVMKILQEMGFVKRHTDYNAGLTVYEYAIK